MKRHIEQIIYFAIAMLLALALFAPEVFGQMQGSDPIVVNYKLPGLICIDNKKPFKNDTCKNPIYFTATLEGVEIAQGDKRFEYMECDHYGCKWIHLRELVLWIRSSSSGRVTPIDTLSNIWFNDIKYPNGIITPNYPR